MRRFELVEGGSSKFWEVALEGATVTVRFGRIGTQGQTQSKVYADGAKAAVEHDKLVREKTGKGYVEQAVAGAASLAPVTPRATSVAAAVPAATPAIASAVAPTAVLPTVPVAAPAIPAPTPLSPPAAVPTAFTITDDPGPEPRPPGIFLWDARWRAELAPFHGEVQAPAPVDADAVLAAFRQGMASNPDRVLPKLAAAAPAGTPPLDPDALPALLRAAPPDPAVWRQVYQALAAVSDSYDPPVTLAAGWKLAMAWHGPAFALACFLEYAERAPLEAVQRMLVNNKRMEVNEFRLRLAALPAAEHAQLLDLWRARDLHPHAALALASLFAGEIDLAREALQHLAARDVSEGELPGFLVHCRMDAAMARQMLELGGRTRWLGGWAWERLAINLIRLGLMPEALEAMNRLAKRMVDGDQLRDYYALRRALDTPQALALLFLGHGRKEAQASIDDFAHRWPELSLRLMAERLAQQPGAEGRDWLAQFARAHGPALPLAAARCEPAARDVLVALARKLGPARAEAALEELPDWLRAPPWRVKGRKARPAFPKLAKQDPVSAMHWAEGERDEWLDGASPTSKHAWYAQHWAGQSSDPAHLLAKFGFDQPTIDALVAGRVPDVWPPTRWLWHSPDVLMLLPTHIAVRLLGVRDPSYWYDFGMPLEALVAWLDAAGIEAVESIAERFAERGLQLAQPLASARIAAVAAQALRTTRRAKAPAQRWLLRHAETAVTALLPRLGEAGSADAAHALRWLLANGRAQQVAAAAEKFGAEGRKACQMLVEFDPMQLAPVRVPVLPEFWAPAGFARPLLPDGRALPAAALDAIGEMLAFSSLDQRYEGIHRLRALCTPRSLGAFAHDLFQNWLRSGASMKEQWAFAALAQIGDDDCAHALAKLLRVWPSDGAFGRAVAGLDVLAGFGSEVALMLLHGIAQKVKSKPLQAKAQLCLAQLAEVRGLDSEQLADRLVPDLDLGDNGTLALDFGARAFTVGFDEHLKPMVLDAEGRPLKDLPAPNKADDPTLAEAATTAWKALKKNVRTLATQQIQRLEQAMVLQRRWTLAEFRQYFVSHPLLRHLVRRLLWAVCDPDSGRPLAGLRVAEDLSLADHEDALLTLPDEAVIGLPHPLELDAGQLAAFGQVFADYEIAQPFPQLGRETFPLSAAEASGIALDRYADKQVATGSVFGLLERGWTRADNEGGWLGALCRPAQANGSVRAFLGLEPGAPLGDTKTHPTQRLQALQLFGRSGYDALPWSRATPILASEILRDVARMASVKA